MKSLSLVLVAIQAFLCPALSAQTLHTALVSIPSASPLAVGPIAAQPGSMAMSQRSLGLGSLSLAAPGSVSVAPAVQAAPSGRAAVAAALASVPELSALAAKLASPQAAPSAQAAAQSVSPMSSLQSATQPKAGQTKEAAASALFDGVQAKAQSKEWTFMVFLNGHNNLDDFGAVNIKGMENVGSNDRLNIVVQWASLGKPTKRMLIQRSESGEVSSPVLEELPAVDMGSVDALYDFFAWTVEKFPAAHYVVDLWNHGAGWHLQKRRGAVTPEDISWDDQSGNHITTEQLGQFAAKAKALIGRPIDVLGFDACLMAMAEVMAQVADSVIHIAGSEQTEPGAGWPYEQVLRQWLASEAVDGAALLKALSEQFVAAYNGNVAFSGLDLTKLPAFIEAVKPFVKELCGLDAAKFNQVRQAAQATQRYAYSDYGDFLDFVTKLANAPVALVSAPVLAAVTEAYKALVVVNHASPDLAASTGASAWMPMTPQLWRQYGARYLGLIWHKLTGWGDFAKRLAAGREGPAAPEADFMASVMTAQEQVLGSVWKATGFEPTLIAMGFSLVKERVSVKDWLELGASLQALQADWEEASRVLRRELQSDSFTEDFKKGRKISPQDLTMLSWTIRQLPEQVRVSRNRRYMDWLYAWKAGAASAAGTSFAGASVRRLSGDAWMIDLGSVSGERLRLTLDSLDGRTPDARPQLESWLASPSLTAAQRADLRKLADQLSSQGLLGAGRAR